MDCLGNDPVVGPIHIMCRLLGLIQIYLIPIKILILNDLTDSVQETVHLAQLDDGKIIYLDKF